MSCTWLMKLCEVSHITTYMESLIWRITFLNWSCHVMCCCQGYNKKEEYIVTQHPLKDTVEDFWRMVWDQNSMSIVLLSKPDEQVQLPWKQANDKLAWEYFAFTLLIHTNWIQTSFLCRTWFSFGRRRRRLEIAVISRWPSRRKWTMTVMWPETSSYSLPR